MTLSVVYRCLALTTVAALVAALPMGAMAFAAAPVSTSALPSGFEDALVLNVPSPTALAFTPDGRMLIASQAGQLWVATGGAAATVALDLSGVACTNSERGLLGIAVDPGFAANGYIYLYYTRKAESGVCQAGVLAYNRVSRFTLSSANVAGDEVVLIDKIASPAGNHNGGDLHIGNDGYLYVSVGDGGSTPERAQQLSSLNGKILRIQTDGGIPPTNPFQGANSVRCNTTGGAQDTAQQCREIFAYGLRNPFRIAFDPNAAGTRFFINDVGQNTWEEIDDGQNGANYGWNVREGHCTNGSTTDCGTPPVGMTNPIHDYGRDTGCASITGGAFVPDGIWPEPYTGSYLFADFVCGVIFALLPATAGWSRVDFATGLGGGSAVHLSFGPYTGPNGATRALYYTTYAGGGSVRRIAHVSAANRPPVAALDAAPRIGAVPLTVNLSGVASNDPDPGDTLTWEWDFGDEATVTTTSPTTTHTYTTAATRTITLRVRDNHGALSTPATVQVGAGDTPPKPAILSPAAGTFYQPGQAFTLTGSATDAEEGALGAAQLTWQVLLHHNDHTHSVLGPVTGDGIAFTAPDHDAGTNYLEVRLTATDAFGLSTTVSRALPLAGTVLPLADVPADHPAREAIFELATRGVIRGYGDGLFGPPDVSLRAQMAALLARAAGWDDEDHGNTFPDQGSVDADLWRNVGTLAFYGVALGYEDGTYDPTGPVLHMQVISFISRAMARQGLWARATNDDPAIYPNVQIAPQDRLDLITFVRNAGAIPDRPANADWIDWDTPASRGWFAQVLWLVLNR